MQNTQYRFLLLTITLAAITSFSITPGYTQVDKAAQKTMDVIDFFVDWKKLKGQNVTVTGCSLSGATRYNIICSAGFSTFFIDSDTLASEDLRQAMRNCAGLKETKDCRADITGTVTTNQFNELTLTNAAMKWTPGAKLPLEK